jgi:hypothetical protein
VLKYDLPINLHTRYQHVRDLDSNDNVLPRGGATYCFLEDETRHVVAMGVAFCGPQDQYNRKIGRDISYGRALKSLHTMEADVVA